jgi:hypothetical protein
LATIDVPVVAQDDDADRGCRDGRERLDHRTGSDNFAGAGVSR